MLPLDWDRVNRLMRTNSKVRGPDEERGASTGCSGPSLDWVRPRALSLFCGMIQTHLVPADREELSQVILHQ